MPVGSTPEVEVERRRKISETLKGKKKEPRKPCSAASLAKRAESMRAHWASLDSAKRVDIGQKIGSSLTGKKQSEAHRLANSKSHHGLVQSAESRLNKSVALKLAYAEGRKQPVRSSHRKGAKFTDEHRERLSQALKGRSVWNKGAKTGPRDLEVSARISAKLHGKKKVITPAVVEGRKRASVKKRGRHQSVEVVQRRSEGLRKAYAEGRHKIVSTYGIGSHYDSPFQGRIWLRSSSELQRARELDAEGLVWFYEAIRYPVVVNGKLSSYTPDFWILPGVLKTTVPSALDVRSFLGQSDVQRVLVEDVKGWWGPKHKTYEKILAFQQQHPHIRFSIAVREGLPGISRSVV